MFALLTPSYNTYTQVDRKTLYTHTHRVGERRITEYIFLQHKKKLLSKNSHIQTQHQSVSQPVSIGASLANGKKKLSVNICVIISI